MGGDATTLSMLVSQLVTRMAEEILPFYTGQWRGSTLTELVRVLVTG